MDDSGMRFLLTDKVRAHDSGSIMAGVSVIRLLVKTYNQPKTMNAKFRTSCLWTIYFLRILFIRFIDTATGTR